MQYNIDSIISFDLELNLIDVDKIALPCHYPHALLLLLFYGHSRPVDLSVVRNQTSSNDKIHYYTRTRGYYYNTLYWSHITTTAIIMILIIVPIECCTRKL